MNAETLRTFKKLSVDFGVIVIGVFVALAAESWWSEREQRQYERDIRDDMIVEFEANVRILDSDIAANETARARLAALIESPGVSLFALDDAALLDELHAVSGWEGFDPEMGSAQAFVESGNVATINDRELRQLMARWAGLLEMRRRFNLQAVEFGLFVTTPVFSKASADGEFSANERRELHALLLQDGQLRATVVENQMALRETAQQILSYLEGRR